MKTVKSVRPLHPERRGAACVEFALVSPLLIMLTLGMMEIGRVVMVKQLMINASREGARLAVLPGTTEAEVQAEVVGALSPSVNGVAVVLSPESITAAPAGTPITVTVRVSAASVSWIPHPLFTLGTDIEASTTMRREAL
jgi:Flp pilus assembly protein TadG